MIPTIKYLPQTWSKHLMKPLLHYSSYHSFFFKKAKIIPRSKNMDGFDMKENKMDCLFLLVLLMMINGVKSGFMLDAAKCEQLQAIPPPDPLLEKEHCSVCEQIVHNSRNWNWAQHYESLCVNIPPHAMSWVRKE